MKTTISVMLVTCVIAFSSHSAFAEQKYEKSINRLGMVTQSYKNVPITRMGHMILPDGWQVSFIDDQQRNYLVSWDAMINRKTQYWHDALEQIGNELQLVFLIDGGKKHVYVTYPGYGRLPGALIINSSSLVFKEDKVTQELIRRAKVNEMNHQRLLIQQELGEMNNQRTELASQLSQLNEQRDNIEQQMKRLSQSAAEAVSIVEMAKKDREVLNHADQIKHKQESKIVGAEQADFIFFVKAGLVLTENAKRFANELGYDLLVIDKRVPTNCDWYQEVEYTISHSDGRQAFAEYIAPYGFKANFSGKLVELVYQGMPENFKGCAR